MDTRRKLHEHFAAASTTTNTTSNNVRESSLINLDTIFSTIVQQTSTSPSITSVKSKTNVNGSPSSLTKGCLEVVHGPTTTLSTMNQHEIFLDSLGHASSKRRKRSSSNEGKASEGKIKSGDEKEEDEEEEEDEDEEASISLRRTIPMTMRPHVQGVLSVLADLHKNGHLTVDLLTNMERHVQLLPPLSLVSLF